MFGAKLMGPVLAGATLPWCLALFAATAAEPKTADDALANLSLEDLVKVKVQTVYGVSKHEQALTEAPSAVTIITKEDIKLFGYRTLADILNSVRGFYVTSDRGYEFIGIRGVNRPGDFGGRILINIDGHRLNDPIYDSALCGREFPLDIDLIERVEVIRGPGSSLYGNNAFFAIVNVITRQGRDIGGHGVELSGTGGSFDSATGRFSFGNKFKNGVETLLSGTWYASAGDPKLFYPEFQATHGGLVRNFDGEVARSLYASVSYAEFSLEAVYGRRDRELPTAAYGTVFDDKRTTILDERAYLELRYHHDDNDWHVLARTYVDHYAFDGTYPYATDEPTGPGVVVEKEQPLAHMLGMELQLGRTLAENHRLTFGLEARYDFQVRQLDYDVNPPEMYTNETTSPANFGVYVQDEYSPVKNLTLNAGIRFDYFTTFGTTVNPRAGVIYHPRPSSTFKALYGQAYRAPNLYELDYHDATYMANPNLRPETIRSYELVWEESVSKSYRVSGSLFYEQIKSLITQVDDSNAANSLDTIFQNDKGDTVRGGEAELEAHWAHGLRGRWSYTLAQAQDSATGRTLSNSPRHVGKAQLAVPMYKEKVFAGLELQAMSSRTTVEDKKLGPVAVANLTVFGKELAKNLEFSAGVYNLFDQRYCDPVGPDFVQDRVRQDGRTFRLKLTYRW